MLPFVAADYLPYLVMNHTIVVNKVITFNKCFCKSTVVQFDLAICVFCE